MARKTDKRPLLEEQIVLTNSETDDETAGRGGDDVHGDPGRRMTSEAAGEVGLGKKLLLCAELLGNEACGSYAQLYSIPILQTLGMPLKLAPLTGVVSGVTTAISMPLFGWLSDGGSNPHRRKVFAVVLSTGLMVMGLACVIFACVLHVKLHGGENTLQPATANKTARPTMEESSELRSSEEIPFIAWLAMAGFIVFEIGYDNSNCFVRAWMLTCSPRSEHTTLLVLGLVMASAGGVSMALLGMVDFSSLLEKLFQGVSSTALALQTGIQGAINIVLLLSGMTLTLVTGLDLLRCGHYRNVDNIYTEARSTDISATCTDSGHTSDPATSKDNSSCDDSDVPGCQPLSSRCKQREVAGQEQAPPRGSKRKELVATWSKSYGTVGQQGQAACSLTEVTRMDKKTRSNTLTWVISKCWESVERIVGKGSACRPMFFICASMCFCCGAYFMFSMMSDYLGKAVYGGNPAAKPGSVSLEKYRAGVRTATWGYLVVSVTYLLFNLVHRRVLAYLGQKTEFVVVQVLLGGTMTGLALTCRLEFFFFLSVVAGLHRACRYVVPYAAASDVIQDEKAASDRPRVGLAMSLVSGMIPLSYVLLISWPGAVEEMTGVLATPLWAGASFASIAAVFFVFV